MRIGVDVGGTHTDAVIIDRQQVIASTKVLTSANVRDGVVNALDEILGESGVDHAAIEAVTVRKSCTEWIDMLNEAGIPCGPIYSLDQTFDDEQVRHLGVAQKVTSPVRGEIEIVGQPVHMSRTPTQLVAPAPEYGEHTDEVLQGLGYSAQETADLRDRGIV